MAVSVSKFGRTCAIWTLMVLAPLAFAGPSLAPSKTRANCEKLLLWSGLWKPKVPQAMIHREGPEILFSGGVIHAYRDDLKVHQQYNRTDRNLSELSEQGYYPQQFLRAKYFAGKRVLDLACGDGSLVEQLRRQGVDAVGLDIYLTAYQKTKPYFVQASAVDTGLPDQSADLIISTQGPISYYFKIDSGFTARTLREAHRVLRPGGTLLISGLAVRVPQGPFQQINVAEIAPQKLLAGTPLAHLPKGLRIKTAPDKTWIYNSSPDDDFAREGASMLSHYWLELERID